MLLHSPFDIVKGVAIDGLHVFFLGVVSDLINTGLKEVPYLSLQYIFIVQTL